MGGTDAWLSGELMAAFAQWTINHADPASWRRVTDQSRRRRCTCVQLHRIHLLLLCRSPPTLSWMSLIPQNGTLSCEKFDAVMWLFGGMALEKTRSSAVARRGCCQGRINVGRVCTVLVGPPQFFHRKNWRPFWSSLFQHTLATHR